MNDLHKDWNEILGLYRRDIERNYGGQTLDADETISSLALKLLEHLPDMKEAGSEELDDITYNRSLGFNQGIDNVHTVIKSLLESE